MGQPKHLKKPVIAQLIESSKKATIVERPTGNAARPTWRIFLLQMRDPFGWHLLDAAKIHYVLTKLREYEGQTWNQILVVDKKKNHPIRIDKLCKDAQDRLKELKLDDVDELISLHLTGEERIFGIRDNEILNILWWDSEHQVCPSPLKYT